MLEYKINFEIQPRNGLQASYHCSNQECQAPLFKSRNIKHELMIT